MGSAGGCVGKRTYWGKLAHAKKLAIVATMLATAHPSPSCCVCGSVDARTLSSTALASGAIVIVCGSHAVAHARASVPARTVRELRGMLGERRAPQGRRDSYHGEIDELARSLSAAFTGERRSVGRRSADA